MPTMASRSTPFRSLLALSIALLVVLLCSQGSGAVAPSFCARTLSRPTCPDLPTYDEFDITSYGGRWFEIGASANFKNLQDANGICVVANNTLLDAPSPGKGAVVRVANTLFSLGAPNHIVPQNVISDTAGQICSQAFSICAQVDARNANLAVGIAIVSEVGLAIGKDHPLLVAALARAKLGINEAIVRINTGIDILAKGVKNIQILNARLGQGQGDVGRNVQALGGAVADLNVTTSAIAAAVQSLERNRIAIMGVASQLAAASDFGLHNAFKLGEAEQLILLTEVAMRAQLAEIETSLANVVGISGLYLTPYSGRREGYNTRVVGTAVQNATSGGKLQVSFPNTPPAKYWVLAVDRMPLERGYAAVLTYSCTQSRSGGIEEGLVVLSRTPQLPTETVERLLGKGAELGVAGECSTPFIYTVQSDSCGSLPPDFPPTQSY